MNVLARVVRCREALADGDIGFAAQILEDLEHELAGGFSFRKETLSCPHCPATFRWPGELDHHERFAHWREAA